MSAEAGFVVCLVATLGFLAGTVASGLRAKRRVHILCVLGAVACLVATIHYAREVGTHFDLASAGWITPVHLWIAKIATGAYLLPAASGLRTIFVPSTRRLHRKLAFLTLSLTVLAAVTGVWMLLAAQRLPG